jgi:hypothetical protein
VVAALDTERLPERDDRTAVAVLAAAVHVGQVIALIHRARLDAEPASAAGIDQRQRVDGLVIAGGADVPRKGRSVAVQTAMSSL